METILSSKLICVICDVCNNWWQFWSNTYVTHVLNRVNCAEKSVHGMVWMAITHWAQLPKTSFMCEFLTQSQPGPLQINSSMDLYVCLQASWCTLRAEFVHLNPAQLHHMLREYNTARMCPPCWTPSPEDSAAALNTCEPKYEHTHTLCFVTGLYNFQYLTNVISKISYTNSLVGVKHHFWHRNFKHTVMWMIVLFSL